MLRILINVPTERAALDRLEGMNNIRVTVIDPVSEEACTLAPDLICDQNAVFCTWLPTNFEIMKELSWVQLASAGYEQLLGWNLPEHGVRATNARGVFDEPIAQWCLAMMINLVRDVRGMIRNQDQGVWDPAARFQQDITDKTVGFWGYGGLARETARLVQAVGSKVVVMTRQGVRPRLNIYGCERVGDPQGVLPEESYTYDQKEEFLEKLDFLVLGMPINATTRGIVGEEDLRRLPNHSFLLNPARGPLVSEEALIKALSEGWIAGAALDTHFYYPMPPEHPLWRMPNVIMTPHISGSAKNSNFLPRIWDLFIQNVQRFSEGRPLLNELSGEELKRPAP